jgi:hypothetical protein
MAADTITSARHVARRVMPIIGNRAEVRDNCYAADVFDCWSIQTSYDGSPASNTSRLPSGCSRKPLIEGRSTVILVASPPSTGTRQSDVAAKRDQFGDKTAGTRPM